MELQELALRSRDEIEQEIHRIYPDPTDRLYANDFDEAMEKRIEMRESIYRLQIEALLDGRLTVEQVVAQHHNPYSEMCDIEDDTNRNLLWQALIDQQNGEKSRFEIVEDTAYHLDLL